MVLGISEFDVEDTLDSMLNDMESQKIQEKTSVQEIPKIKDEEKNLKISRWQIFCNRLTEGQIKLINDTGELPSNAKFVTKISGGYKIVNNWFNIRTGTCILPFGYEVKRNILGFTEVLPVGSKGLFIKHS